MALHAHAPDAGSVVGQDSPPPACPFKPKRLLGSTRSGVGAEGTVLTRRKTMLLLAMLALAGPIGPSFAADLLLTAPQPLATTGAHVEAPSGESISSSAYNEALAANNRDHYCRSGSCDTAPALLSARAPVYPAGALDAETEGRAAVLFDIDAQGVPQNLTVQSATAAGFGEAALEAVRNWRFRPATLGGNPVGYQRALQVFPFELRD